MTTYVDSAVALVELPGGALLALAHENDPMREEHHEYLQGWFLEVQPDGSVEKGAPLGRLFGTTGLDGDLEYPLPGAVALDATHVLVVYRDNTDAYGAWARVLTVDPVANTAAAGAAVNLDPGFDFNNYSSSLLALDAGRALLLIRRSADPKPRLMVISVSGGWVPSVGSLTQFDASISMDSGYTALVGLGGGEALVLWNDNAASPDAKMATVVGVAGTVVTNLDEVATNPPAGGFFNADSAPRGALAEPGVVIASELSDGYGGPLTLVRYAWAAGNLTREVLVELAPAAHGPYDSALCMSGPDDGVVLWQQYDDDNSRAGPRAAPFHLEADGSATLGLVRIFGPGSGDYWEVEYGLWPGPAGAPGRAVFYFGGMVGGPWGTFALVTDLAP